MSHTNYNDIAKEKKGAPVPETKDDTVVTPDIEGIKAPETITEPESQTEPEFVFGTVVGCTKLNVRKEPNVKAQIICVIEKDTQVLVMPDESTDEWYKVDVGGQQGFCMKKYMTTNA